MDIRLPLTQLTPNKRAIVVGIRAGWGLIGRLDSLGIRIGSEIEAISGPFARGPVTVKVGNLRTAIGFGAANKVMVKIKELES